jgi:hypothetical protein
MYKTGVYFYKNSEIEDLCAPKNFFIFREPEFYVVTFVYKESFHIKLFWRRLFLIY